MDYVLLTVRGTLAPKTLEETRVLHNETAGSAPGMAAARALSDMSHTVFAPVMGLGDLSGAKQNELMFIDYWEDPQGLMKFFGDPRVGEQGSKLFTSKDPTVWMPAVGAYSFDFPATNAAKSRYLGVFRSQVKSPEKTVEVWRKLIQSRVRDARRRGQLSHHLFFRLPAPGESLPPEVVGLDLWSSLDGLKEHYSDRSAYGAMNDILAGAPQASVWEQPAGFNEW
jgi:hypothetical protein